MKRLNLIFDNSLNFTLGLTVRVSKISTNSAAIGLTAVLISLTTNGLFAATPVYSHREADGSVVFSDAPLVNGEMVRTSYQAQYGRPVATASCLGLSAEQMATRAKSFEPAIKNAANAHSVDADLIRAVAQVESCFDPKAVSKVGAEGLMQLMPTTAAELGVTDSFNAVQNINGGTNYLAKMLDRFNHNHQYALAAYNAGPGAVEKHQGIPPFPETQKYVKKVLDLYSGKH